MNEQIATAKHAKAIYDKVQEVEQKLNPLIQMLSSENSDERTENPLQNIQEILEALLNSNRILHVSLNKLHDRMDELESSLRRRR
ncbi:hypothetical protein BKD02_15925 [Brucella sp. 09RB8910]|nr:hypothetical protein BKD02_15925 [Brucella sp. 09RB8910]